MNDKIRGKALNESYILGGDKALREFFFHFIGGLSGGWTLPVAFDAALAKVKGEDWWEALTGEPPLPPLSPSWRTLAVGSVDPVSGAEVFCKGCDGLGWVFDLSGHVKMDCPNCHRGEVG